MSFFEKALKIAKTTGDIAVSTGKFAINTGTLVVNQIDKSANEVRLIHDKYKDFDDNKLFNIVNNTGFTGSSSKEIGVASKLLKERGFSIEEINAKR